MSIGVWQVLIAPIFLLTKVVSACRKQTCTIHMYNILKSVLTNGASCPSHTTHIKELGVKEPYIS